jgi:hypothetical protein
MAASASDKARKSYSYLQKTLSVGINASDTALTPNNISSIPTDTGVSFVVDRVDSSGTTTPTKRELMTGVISGSTIASLQRGEQGTTAQAHLANAVIEFVNSGEMWNDLIDFLLQDHSNPGGNHKTLTDDNSNEWLERGQTASAVNQVKITNAATNNAPQIAANGDDTNIDLKVDAKGTGLVKVQGAVPQKFFALYNFIESGCVWSGDSYGSTRAASMTAGVVWIGGKRLTVAAVTARTFTASKDTYVDFQDNSDGTASITYTEATNNAASPALPSSATDATNVRCAIIVTGAGNIANVGSVNQGEETKVLPIASSIPYAVTDSLGYLIAPRDPQRRVLGYRQITSDFTTTSATKAQVTGLSVPFQMPNGATGRKVKVYAPGIIKNGTAGNGVDWSIWDGVVGSGTELVNRPLDVPGASYRTTAYAEIETTPSAASKTYNLATSSGGGVATTTVLGASTVVSFLKVELA